MDYYRPSLPILPFYNSNNETEPRASQVETVNPSVENNYYKQILIIGKQESDPKIIRKLKDIQQDKTKYPEFHFVITQYNKILEGTPINRAIANTNSIVIKLNTAIEDRTERRLNYLLRDLKRKYGELSVKFTKQKSNYSKKCIFYLATTGEVVGKIGFGADAYVYVVNEDVITIKDFKKELEYINSATFETNIIIKSFSPLGKNQTTETYIDDFLKKNTIELGMTNAELNVRAFLSTITEMEGAGYNIKIGGDTFEGDNHPGGQYLNINGKRTYVSAAGAYQIVEKTSEGLISQNDNINNFSPENQDRMAMQIMKNMQNSLTDVKNGKFEIAVKKLTGQTGKWVQWAALPGGDAKSKPMSKFYEILEKHKIKELKGNSGVRISQGKLFE